MKALSSAVAANETARYLLLAVLAAAVALSAFLLGAQRSSAATDSPESYASLFTGCF